MITQIKEKITEHLTDADPAIKQLVICAVLYIREDTKPESAQKRILRYVKTGDCTGFHSLFLHKEDDSMAKKEYEVFLSGEIQINPIFCDFGKEFLVLYKDSGIDILSM